MLEQRLTYSLRVGDTLLWGIPLEGIRGCQSCITGQSSVTADGFIDAVDVAHNVGLDQGSVVKNARPAFLVRAT